MKILIVAEHKNGALAEATCELFGLPLGQAEIHAVVAGEASRRSLNSLANWARPRCTSSSPALAGGTGNRLAKRFAKSSCKLPSTWCLSAHAAGP